MIFDTISLFIDKGTKIYVYNGLLAPYSGKDNYDKDVAETYSKIQYLGDGKVQALHDNGKPNTGVTLSNGHSPTTDNTVDVLVIRLSQNCEVRFKGGKIHCKTMLTQSHRICNLARYLDDGNFCLESAFNANTPMPIIVFPEDEE